MDGKDKDQAHKPHQDIQDKRKDESSNPISHELASYLIEG
jgi:hypothetical protein